MLNESGDDSLQLHWIPVLNVSISRLLNSNSTLQNRPIYALALHSIILSVRFKFKQSVLQTAGTLQNFNQNRSKMARSFCLNG